MLVKSGFVNRQELLKQARHQFPDTENMGDFIARIQAQTEALHKSPHCIVTSNQITFTVCMDWSFFIKYTVGYLKIWPLFNTLAKSDTYRCHNGFARVTGMTPMGLLFPMVNFNT